MQGDNVGLEFKVRERKKKISLGKIAWIFAIPAFVVQLIFGWYPLIASFIVAFQEFSFFGNKFVGFANFQYFFDDPMFYKSFINTLYYAGLSLALTFLVPILIAILLMEMKKGVIRVMMLLWFIPVASMAGLIIWSWFYNPQYGFFNGILVSLGLPTSTWLGNSRIVILCLVLPGLIMFAPGLVYIASLQSIPESFYEAAELEGASFFKKIWHITLPRLRPIIAMMLILAVIGNLQVFQQPYVMTGGGPNFASYTVVMYIYEIAFRHLKFGRGTALAVMFFFVIMAIIIIQRKYFKENIDT